ncbi:predicted protein [Thalassiosira pseudonana CCMP1335]|uniref:Sulfotransferase domain-containing protein n=1 Tax=Thalassiosira pseudonana TaxID=35128 RepID=B8C5M7_THAPS|nr:predicted protein [Thalassiosira pseudonana CCMP1335]EED91147.1 predicted protein [Thalassiosira pseudonana CCMP1335]
MIPRRPPSIRKPSQSISIAAILALCIFGILNFELEPTSYYTRRFLSLDDLDTNGEPAWITTNLIDLHQKPNPSEETPLFWHIPKSGGTTAKRLYMCMGLTQTIRIGIEPRYGYAHTEKLVVFNPYPKSTSGWKTANVDTTLPMGIIFSMEMGFALDHLYDAQHKARSMALFRHPIDRLVSKFYYLQIADWERSYRPEWSKMTLLNWAKSNNPEDNFMVRKIVGKQWNEKVTQHDLYVAKKVLKDHVVVGLMNESEESFRRFSLAIGIDESERKNQECMKEFFEPDDGAEVAKNSNQHRKVFPDTAEWNVLAAKNTLDMDLYEYVERLFEEQKEIIDSYAHASHEAEEIIIAPQE